MSDPTHGQVMDSERAAVEPDPIWLLRRFAALSALAYLPLGLLVPTYVLLLGARGFGPGAIGALMGLTAIVTVVLELPTGGLADVVGRRVVLIAAALAMAAGFACVGGSSDHRVIVVGLVLYAIGNALSSGPLTSWFVDEVNETIDLTERDDVITRGLSLGAMATGVAIAVGSVAAGWLASLGVALGLEPSGDAGLIGLSVPALLAAALMLVDVVALLTAMHEPPRSRSSLRDVLATVPVTVRQGVALVIHSRVLRWFSLRWAVVPIGFLAFELVTPLRLGELLDHPSSAASVFGVVVAVAYLGQSLSALAAPRLARLGRLRVSAALTVLAGGAFAVAGIGGTIPLVVAVMWAMLVAGPVNALNGPIVHAEVGAGHRTTLLSLESLAQHVAVAIGAVLLGAVARTSGTATAFTLAGTFTALGAIPLIGVARARVRGRHVPA